MKQSTLFLALLFAANLFAQPDTNYVAINPADVQNILQTKDSMLITKVRDGENITVDGIVEEMWSSIPKTENKSFIKHSTVFENSAFSQKSLLADGSNTHRIPTGTNDFSSNYGIMFDDDYLYLLLDVVDDEVNEGKINTGIHENIELLVAPYADSAAKALAGKPYPPYTGVAPEINKKYAYWNYLGAYQILFTLKDSGKCNVTIPKKTDALNKIYYEQRQGACLCAWKPRTDGKSGYIAELGVSFKITMADSANNPFKINYDPCEPNTEFSLEMLISDNDSGKKPIIATMKTENYNVRDASLWTSKLLIVCWDICEQSLKNTEITNSRFSPNPASTHINFEESISLIEIYSLEGRLQIQQQHTNTVNVSTLPSGMYVVKGDGIVLGKMVKE